MNQALPRQLLAPRHWPAWLGIGLFAILAWLPWRTRRWLGKQLGKLFYAYHAKRRKVVQINLHLCFPELAETQREQLAQQHFQEYAHALLDYSLLFFRSRRWLYQRCRIQGQEHIDNAIAAGQNIILQAAHSVWLEFAGAALGQHYRMVGFYKPLPNPVADWLVARSRWRDADVLMTRADGMMKLVRVLEPGRLVFFMPDEDHGLKNSVFVPFFNIPKATLTTPARLTKLGKAASIPVMAYFNADDGCYQIVLQPAMPDFPGNDEQDNAARVNAELEHLIRRGIHQYMWTLKLFRTRPAKEAKLY